MLKLNHRAGHCQNRVTYISCLPLRIQLICDCALLHSAADIELGQTNSSRAWIIHLCSEFAQRSV